QLGVMLPSTMSRAVGAGTKLTFAPPGPVASLVMLPGTVTTGAVVSSTVMVNDSLVVFPCRSDDVQFTTVVVDCGGGGRIGNVSPEAWVHVTGRGPSTMSTAVGGSGAQMATAPAGLVASLICDGGMLMSGP